MSYAPYAVVILIVILELDNELMRGLPYDEGCLFDEWSVNDTRLPNSVSPPLPDASKGVLDVGSDYPLYSLEPRQPIETNAALDKYGTGSIDARHAFAYSALGSPAAPADGELCVHLSDIFPIVGFEITIDGQNSSTPTAKAGSHTVSEETAALNVPFPVSNVIVPPDAFSSRASISGSSRRYKHACLNCGRTFDRHSRARDCQNMDLGLTPHRCRGRCNSDAWYAGLPLSEEILTNSL